MMEYLYSAETVSTDHLEGFFEGWPKPPSKETHLTILHNSGEIVLARDSETGAIVGFINAITDHVLSAYIPLLEVLPDYRKRGIGAELVRRMFERLDGLYMIDLVCDDDMVPFYTRTGMQPFGAMAIRNFAMQAGRPAIHRPD